MAVVVLIGFCSVAAWSFAKIGSAKSTAGRSKFYLKEVGIQHGFSLFRNEFVRLLAQELGVSYEYLRDNVDFLVKLVVLV